MSIRYTKATRELLRFIDEYDFITINIAKRIFYKGRKNGYEQARMRLATLYKHGVLKRYESVTGEFIYQNKINKVSDHRKYTIEAYSRIVEMAEVLYFKREVSWICDKYRNDAHIIYRKGDKLRALLIEFEKYSKTSSEKIDIIYESNEVQEWYKEKFGEEIFPGVLLITESGRSNCECKNGKWTSLVTDYTFSNLKGLL